MRTIERFQAASASKRTVDHTVTRRQSDRSRRTRAPGDHERPSPSAARQISLAGSLTSILVALVLAGALCTPVASAQDIPDLTDGFTPPEIAPGAPFGSYSLSGFDHINYYSGQMGVALPLRAVGGRGEAGYTVTLQIGQRWAVDRTGSEENPIPYFSGGGELGQAPGRITGRKVADMGQLWPCAPGLYMTQTLTRLTFTTASGSEIELRDKLTNGEPHTYPSPCEPFESFSRGTEFVASDGSGITFIADSDIYDINTAVASETFTPSGRLYFPNGMWYHFDTSGRVNKIVDRNGNYITFEYNDPFSALRVTKITDSLKRVTTITYDISAGFYNGCNQVSYDQIDFKGYQGANRQIKIYRGPLGSCGSYSLLQSGSITSYAQLFPDLNVGLVDDFKDRLVDKVVLPDGKTYEFKYNPYGELAWIKLPSGARYEYTWASGTGSGGGGHEGKLILRKVTEKRTYIDDTTSTVLSKITFDRESTSDCQPLSSMAGTVATVTYFDGPSTEAGREKHYYCGVAGDSADAEPWDYATWKIGREYKTEVLDLSTVVRSTKLTWAQRPSAGEPIWWGTLDDDDAPPNDPRVSASEKTLHDVVPNLVAKQEYGYDQYNNRTDVLEFDYNQLTTPVRRTHFEYVTASAYVNAGPHLRGLVSKQWLCGSGAGNCTEGAAVAKTEYIYDGSSLLNRFAPTGHEGGYGTGYTTRGNVTTLRQWRNLPTAKWIETNIEYDELGIPWKAIDPKGNMTQAAYLNNFSTAPPELTGSDGVYAFPSAVTNALNHTVNIQYDYYLGRPSLFADSNGVQTRYEQNDSLDRLTKVLQAYNVPADIQQTRFTYSDYFLSGNWQGTKVEAFNDQFAYDDQRHLSLTIYDRLGRVRSQRTRFDLSYYNQVTSTFDGLGRLTQRTYPYVASVGSPDFPELDHTTSAYDKLGRPISVTKPGGAAVTSSYSGNMVNVVDEAAKHRQMAYDALGRLKRVVEDPSGLGYVTDYTYNALDKLTQVTQNVGGGTQQTRTFTYDSLGRTLTADNPEDVGSIQYAYDDKGNVTTRTDARSATATMTYDALNRVTQKAYSGAPGASPTVRYCYDGNVYDLTTNTCVAASPAISYAKGKLTGEGVEDWTATNYTGFDARGRVTASVQRTLTSGTTETAYSFSYSYNRDGTLATETYPSGKVVSFAYDRAGRPVNIAELTGPLTTYVSSVVYADQGTPAEIVFGNSLTEQSCYSARDQMITRRLGTGTQTNCSNPGGADLLHLNFGFGADTANNGNLMQQTITAPSFSQTQYYGYDGVNRLKAASEGAPLVGGTTCPTTQSWCREYGYEAFGNRWVSFSNNTLHFSTPTDATDFNTATNRLTGTGITYDNAGNLTAHPNITPGAGGMVYNASNKMIQFTATGVSVSYRYDPRQRRVRLDSGGETTIWVYDAFGRSAAEYSTNLTMVQGVYYRTTDHLGSTRIVTSQSSAVVQRRDFFPFGEAIAADSSHGNRHLLLDAGQATYNTPVGIRQQFTSQQRDSESGLDYFWARNYSPAIGQFLSMDPGGAGARYHVSASWNSFGYVWGNPMRYLDPDGLDPRCAPGTEDTCVDVVAPPLPGVVIIWERPRSNFTTPADDPHFCDIAVNAQDHPEACEVQLEVEPETPQPPEPEPTPDIELDDEAKAILADVYSRVWPIAEPFCPDSTRAFVTASVLGQQGLAPSINVGAVWDSEGRFLGLAGSAGRSSGRRRGGSTYTIAGGLDTTDDPFAFEVSPGIPVGPVIVGPIIGIGNRARNTRLGVHVSFLIFQVGTSGELSLLGGCGAP